MPSSLPKQPRYRARWLTNREGVEFFMRDQLNRQVSQHTTVDDYGSGRRATKAGAHHRHHAAGTKRLPKVGAGVGWLAFKRRLGRKLISVGRRRRLLKG